MVNAGIVGHHQSAHFVCSLHIGTLLAERNLD